MRGTSFAFSIILHHLIVHQTSFLVNGNMHKSTPHKVKSFGFPTERSLSRRAKSFRTTCGTCSRAASAVWATMSPVWWTFSGTARLKRPVFVRGARRAVRTLWTCRLETNLFIFVVTMTIFRQFVARLFWPFAVNKTALLFPRAAKIRPIKRKGIVDKGRPNFFLKRPVCFEKALQSYIKYSII